MTRFSGVLALPNGAARLQGHDRVVMEVVQIILSAHDRVECNVAFGTVAAGWCRCGRTRELVHGLGDLADPGRDCCYRQEGQ